MNILLIFGGQSFEHKISIESAKNIYYFINKNKYTIFLVYLSYDNKMYLLEENELLNFTEKYNYKNNTKCYFNTMEKQKLIIGQNKVCIDLAVPIIHGNTGEDGVIQGVFKFLDIPFLSSNILSLSITYNKQIMKDIMLKNNIPTNKYILIKTLNNLKKQFKKIKNKYGIPFFIKPTASGSSLGIFKIYSYRDFKKNIKSSFKYSSEILAEKMINGKELEIYCFKINNKIHTTIVGEIITENFYDYKSKYIDTSNAVNNIPANISKKEVKFVKKIAKKTYDLFKCKGMIRIDLFITLSNKILINEINSIPGYTDIINRKTLIKASNYSYENLFELMVKECLIN